MLTFFLRPIRLQLNFRLISAILSKKQRHTLRHTYIQINTRDPIALFSKLSYESDITVQNTLIIKNGWNKVLKGFIPLFFFLLVSGIRDSLDKSSRECWSKGIEGVISSGQKFL